MIVPVINMLINPSDIQIVDTTPSDNVANSNNYSSGINNTNYERNELHSVAIQIIENKEYKQLIVKPENSSDIYTVTLAELGLSNFKDALYSVVYVLLFDEANGTASVVDGSTTVTLTDPADKAILLSNKVLYIANQLYDIDTTAVTDTNKIELLTPYKGTNGIYSYKHGYRQNDAVLNIPGITACVMKKIASVGCECSSDKDVQTLYMNYKSIIANFDIGNFGKAIDLISFASTECSESKVKNCGCGC